MCRFVQSCKESIQPLIHTFNRFRLDLMSIYRVDHQVIETTHASKASKHKLDSSVILINDLS